jgi:hypothetical protein
MHQDRIQPARSYSPFLSLDDKPFAGKSPQSQSSDAPRATSTNFQFLATLDIFLRRNIDIEFIDCPKIQHDAAKNSIKEYPAVRALY